MTNRVIKDSIWTSPTLAALSDFSQDQFPRWLLLADDWGCFEARSRVIKGLAYPLRDSVTPEIIEYVKNELYQAGLLFIWKVGDREWGYFVSWDSHNQFCNKTNVDEQGKNQKHRRKTPEPPENELIQYLQGNRKELDNLGHLGTVVNKILNPNPNPVPNQNPITPPTPPSGGEGVEKSFCSSFSADEQTVEAEKVTGRAKTQRRSLRKQAEPEGFESFWQAYPKKISKGQARRTWQRLNPTEQLQGKILATLERAKTSDQWAKENGRFIPHASTWLNAEGWDDEHIRTKNPMDEWLESRMKAKEAQNVATG